VLELKEEIIARIFWRILFGKGYGTVVRQDYVMMVKEL
jgi:hypothetical protein